MKKKFIYKALIILSLLLVFNCNKKKEEMNASEYLLMLQQELTPLFDEIEQLKNEVNLNVEIKMTRISQIEAIFSRLHPNDNRKYEDFDFNNIDTEFPGESILVNKLLNEIIAINDENQILEVKMDAIRKKIRLKMTPDQE